MLRTEIVRGLHAQGLLPSEAELAKEHQVSRNTVREALALLRTEGLVDRVQGAGTFAVTPKAIHRFDEASSFRGAGSYHEVLALASVNASRLVAQSLGIAPGDEVVMLERRTSGAGGPLGLWTTYLPAAIGEPLHRADVRDLSGDYFDMLEGVLGLELAGSNMVTEAVLSDGDVAALLGIPEGSPLLLLQRTVLDRDGRAVDFSFGRLRADRITLATWCSRDGRRSIELCAADEKPVTPAQREGGRSTASSCSP